ncbi:PKD domain-containing protein [Neptuniibacter sp. QD57_21]|uniref:PKD domain-containing protein n=1 Tax=Neptuniibacter sp. QD57_21 TaxID=3398213 RepID=UPI0039F4896E
MKHHNSQITAFKMKLLPLAMSACLLPSVASAIESATYTLDADFSQGILNGLNYDVIADQLQINENATTFPLLWIANASEASVSKLNTDSNCETARYKTWFVGGGSPWAGAAPSRTAVDADGNVYVSNRHFDGKRPLVMKILNDSFIDRDGDGQLDTSTDANGDCRITPDEMMPLVDLNGDGRLSNNELTDERIAWVAEAGDPGRLGRSLCIGNDGNLWLGTYYDRRYYKLSSADGSLLAGPYSVGVTPYGCVVNSNGKLYSAGLSNLLGELDTNTGTQITRSHHQSYGISIGNDKIYLSNRNGYSFSEFNPASNTFSTPTGYTGISSLGISVDGEGNILVGNQNGGMYKYKPDGTLLWSSPAQAGTGHLRGVVVDANGDVWGVHVNNNNVSKYDGSTGAHLGVFPVGAGPYTYSDASGIGVRNSTLPSGLWTFVHDSGEDDSTWDAISWTDLLPEGTSVEVKIRSANTEEALGAAVYQTVNNGVAPANVIGRYAQVQVRLAANEAGDSPEFYDLTLNWELAAPPLVPPVVSVSPDATSINEGSNFSASGSFSDPDNSTGWSGTVNYGDGTIEPLVINEAAMTFSLSHIYGDNGLYTVSVELNDADGGSDGETHDVTVFNVVPMINQLTVDPLVSVNSTVNLDVSFDDDGFLDTHTTEVDWGDGTPNEFITVDNANNTAAGSHVYTEPGVYTVTVTVADDDGASAQQTYQYVVVYDPSAGFVTGGGYINSPLGAYVADPNMVGKASYGFVARYKKGKSVPDGQTQFQFKAGDLNFHSASYEWLVVAGSRAQFKGDGTINGEGDYGFMLTAIDAAINNSIDVDQFRIKIWDKASGAIVYDNLIGEADDTDSLTSIAGGNIVIHTSKKK